MPFTSTGIVAGTKVASSMGWKPVENLSAGDLVLTFDDGMQPLRAVRHQVLKIETDRRGADWPLRVPQGALGNQSELYLLPQQPVLIESDTAEAMSGDPFVLILAGVLCGVRGIEQVGLSGRVEVTTLEFADEQLVFANVGTLFHCAAPATDKISTRSYEVLSREDGELIAACLQDEDWSVDAAVPRAAYA
ncbi:Hint domain-containing protein [Pelagovum pacificum]|nr:Hint domain-containing protein [Pelagovum pacificum]QQA43326.1 Hint domain-containing protein [Pelagovum pacificum]